MKKVKHKRFISIIKTCKLLRNKSFLGFLGFGSIVYGFKIIMTEIERILMHDKNSPYIITTMQHPLKNKYRNRFIKKYYRKGCINK